MIRSPPVYDYSMRYTFAPKIAGRRAELASRKTLVFRGQALNDTPCPVQPALITRDGSVIWRHGVDRAEKR